MELGSRWHGRYSLEGQLYRLCANVHLSNHNIGAAHSTTSVSGGDFRRNGTSLHQIPA